MLVQIDASEHAWFGNKKQKATLFAAIDDATGKVLAARFGQHEDAQGYFLLFADIVVRLTTPAAMNSIPQSRSGLHGPSSAAGTTATPSSRR
jgi:hypothetical protein